MIIGYCRVSTGKASQDTSVKAQREQLKAAGCIRIIEERRSAFKAGKRPGWETCKALISSGQVTAFVVVSLSRASRRQETAEMSELCTLHGVEFIALTGGPVDVSTPEGLLNVGIQDTVNRFDSLMKSVRVKQGQAARRRDGATAVGRCPFGYKYDGTKPVPDPKQWKQARRLWDDLRAVEFVANRVLRAQPDLPFSNVGLIKWMRNPLLMGRPTYTSQPVEPLVSPAEWHQVQKLLTSRRLHVSRAPRQNRLFTQLVECQSCSRWMGTTSSGKVPKPRLKCLNPKCKWYGRGLAEWKVRDQVIAALRDAVPQMVQIVEQATQTTDQPLTPEQIAAQQQLDQLLALQASGVPALDTAISDLREQLIVTTPDTPPDWTGLAEVLSLPGVLEEMTDSELRAVMLDLVDQILYVGNPAAVEIRLR